MTHRVVVTGMAGISPLGCDWPSVFGKLKSYTNAIRYMKEWEVVEGLNSLLAAPAAPFELSERFTRRSMRSMSRNSIMACRTAELALKDAGLIDADWIHEGEMGIAYGSCAGDPKSFEEIAALLHEHTTRGLNATTYVRFMSHTSAVNIGVLFSITGRVITTTSACTSGSQAVGYAYEAIKNGYQRAMIAGGSEECSVANTAIFDTLFATSTGHNDDSSHSPRPFDADRDGLVLGEGACTLILETLESALERNAPIYAEVAGFATNSDGKHITNPDSVKMAEVMREALRDAEMTESDIGYINAHGTATISGDIAESQATAAVFGDKVPVSTLKSYMGHTLGACGALESWLSIEMMREGWFAPTINLTKVDERCGKLDYIMNTGRSIQSNAVMSNNFAFGGINTSLIFKRFEK